MVKNGLFIVSIGLIIFLYSANAQSGVYNWVNLITSIVVMASGAMVAYLGHKKTKKAKNSDHENN